MLVLISDFKNVIWFIHCSYLWQLSNSHWLSGGFLLWMERFDVHCEFYILFILYSIKGLFCVGNMDPYVIITCRTQEKKSSVASGWIHCFFAHHSFYVSYKDVSLVLPVEERASFFICSSVRSCKVENDCVVFLPQGWDLSRNGMRISCSVCLVMFQNSRSK